MADITIEVPEIAKELTVSTDNISDSGNVVTSFVGVEDTDSDGNIKGYQYTISADEANIASNYTYTKTIQPSSADNATFSKIPSIYPPSTLTADLKEIRENLSEDEASITYNDLRLKNLEAWQQQSGTLTVGDLKTALYGDLSDTTTEGDFKQLTDAVQGMFENLFELMLDDNVVTSSNFSTYLPQLTYSFDRDGDTYGGFECTDASLTSSITSSDNSYYNSWTVRPADYTDSTGATAAKGIINGAIISEDSIPINRLDGWTSGEWLTNIGSDMIPPTKIFPVGVKTHKGSLDSVTREITDLNGFEDGSVTSFDIDELIGDGAITNTQIANKTITKDKLAFDIDNGDDVARVVEAATIPDKKISGVMKQDARDVFCGDLFINTQDKYFWSHHDYRTILGKGNYLTTSGDGQTVVGRFNAPDSKISYPFSVGGGKGDQDNLKISVVKNESGKSEIIFVDEYDNSNLSNGDLTYTIRIEVHGYDETDYYTTTTSGSTTTKTYTSQETVDKSVETFTVTYSASGVSNPVNEAGYYPSINNSETQLTTSLMEADGKKLVFKDDIESTYDIDMIQYIVIKSITVNTVTASDGKWYFSFGDSQTATITPSSDIYTIWADRYYVFNVFRVSLRKTVFTIDYSGNVNTEGSVIAAGFEGANTIIMPPSDSSMTVGHVDADGYDYYTSGRYYKNSDGIYVVAFSIPIHQFVPWKVKSITVNNLKITVTIEDSGVPAIANGGKGVNFSNYVCTTSTNAARFKKDSSSWVAYEEDTGSIRVLLPLKEPLKTKVGGSKIEGRSRICNIAVHGFKFILGKKS